MRLRWVSFNRLITPPKIEGITQFYRSKPVRILCERELPFR